MEKKIYIVTSGEYSEYKINAVFSTKEKANAYIQQHGTYYDIEEYDLDEEVEKKSQLWSIVFCIENGKFDEANPISYNKNKEVDTCYVEERFGDGKMYYIIFLVDADSMNRAVKIARERFAAVKANEYIWLRLTRPYELDRYGKRKYESFNVKTNEFIKE
jgi:hypothetical protein